ncbi:MAG: FAD:protein FMN transferase [Candidatus Sericytochromatia bacterium]
MKNKHIISLISLFLLLISFTSSSIAKESPIKKYTQAQYIMGTIFKIEIYSEDKNKANLAFKEAFKEIRRCDTILSDYRKDSELAKVLEEASSHPVKVSDDFFYITKRALYFSNITNGLFDITIQPLIKLWGFKDKNFKIPTKKQIDEVKSYIGYGNIILDEDNKTIFIKNSKTKLDFGAIGKGYAIDKAVNVLKKIGIKSAFVDSTSNQYYLGTPPNKSYWTVGIKDPRNTNKILKYLYIKNKSISTSGDYEQFFIKDKKRYSHIINPITGYPIKDAIASTIVSESSTDSDALSTSILLINKEDINNFIKSFCNTNLCFTYNIFIQKG